MEPEENEEVAEYESDARGSWIGRVSSIGITLVVVAALAFFGRDLVPAGVAEQLARRLGVDEFAWLLSSSVQSGPRETGPAAEVSDIAVDDPVVDEAGLATPSAIPGEPERSFAIQFPSDSDLLDYDAWITLDRAAALLRAQPELFALIDYRSDQSMDKLSSRELAMVRIAAVEQYLVTAGVERDRLRQEGSSSAGGEDDPESTSGRFITIAIGSGMTR